MSQSSPPLLKGDPQSKYLFRSSSLVTVGIMLRLQLDCGVYADRFNLKKGGGWGWGSLVDFITIIGPSDEH